jgi:hypothetical protein
LGADQQSARGDFLRHEVRGPHDFGRDERPVPFWRSSVLGATE